MGSPRADAPTQPRKRRTSTQVVRAELARVTGLLLLSRKRMERVSALSHDRVMVGLSGGKDSLVTLDLCCKYISHVEAYYMYLVPGLEAFECHVDAAAKRHGIKVHKVPHFDLARLVRHAVLRPPTKGCNTLRIMQLRDIEFALRDRTGITWMAMGERATDSFNRRFYTRRNDGIDERVHRTYPIWDWCDRDVYGYLRARGIKPPDNRGYQKARVRVSGFSLSGQCLSWLKVEHPRDYKRVLRVFPYADSEIRKYELRQESARDQDQGAARLCAGVYPDTEPDTEHASHSEPGQQIPDVHH